MPTPETTTPQLTEDAVREIEARANAASPTYVVDWSKGEHALLQASGWRPAGEEQPRTIATFDKDDGYLDLLFCAEARVDIPALIRDWRAMRAENGDLRKSVEDWVTHYNEVEAWRAQLSATNAALREQLAEAESEVRGVLAALGDNAIHSHPDGGTENIYESLAISVARLQSQLAQVTSERDEVRRLLRRQGNF